MELHEIEKQLKMFFGDRAIGVETAMELIQSYGKEQYNKALDLAAEKCNYPYRDEYGCGCDVPSIILGLKQKSL